MNRLASMTLMFCVSIVPAYARNDISSSGNAFLEICSSIDKPKEQWNEIDFLNVGLCEGYMSGIQDGIGISFASVKNAEGSVQDLGMCLPSDGTVELGQMIRVVLKYIRQNPEQAHLPSATLVVVAAKNAFPCGKAVPKQ